MFNLVTTGLVIIVLWIIAISQIFVPLFKGEKIFPVFRHKDVKIRLDIVEDELASDSLEKKYIERYDDLLDSKIALKKYEKELKKKKLLWKDDGDDYLF